MIYMPFEIGSKVARFCYWIGGSIINISEFEGIVYKHIELVKNRMENIKEILSAAEKAEMPKGEINKVRMFFITIRERFNDALSSLSFHVHLWHFLQF